MSQTFKDHFSTVAGRYADFRPRYPAALFEYLATVAPRNSTVWDCAAGNGQASTDLAERFDKIIATDASAKQIASASRHSRIEYRVALAEQSGLTDGSIGLITVAQALHWFDLNRFYAEARRVLVRGGVLAVWAYGTNMVEGDEVNHLVQDYYSNIVGPYWPPERKVVEGGYRSLPFPFAEIVPPAFRMEMHWTLDQLLGYFSTWSATSRFIEANGRNPIGPLADALARVWGDVNAPRRVAWQFSLRLGRNEK